MLYPLSYEGNPPILEAAEAMRRGRRRPTT